jgi:two-component system, NtrC family, sensor kinase
MQKQNRHVLLQQKELEAMYNEPIKILCVDDEKNVLRALERLFLDDDYGIFLADSGEEGLKILEEEGPFQVVISDYRMPVMNGVDFLKAVYQKQPETVRIVLSGYADAGAIVAAINDGHIYKFIPKPWNDEELRVTINNSLERYFLQKNNRELIEQLAVVNHQLEEKVRERTEQLELHVSALEFAQQLMWSLPVGVVGIDENNMVAHCNTVAASLLKNICSDFLGADVVQSCNLQLNRFIEKVRREKMADEIIELNDKDHLVMGRVVKLNQSEAVVLVFTEK